MDLLLVRHGQTDWNPIQRVMGHSPIGLNETGKKQAQNLADWLQKIPLDLIYSSTMPRALQTAEIIAKGRKVEIIPDPGVAEIDYGDWVGLTFKDLEEKHAAHYHAYRFQASTMAIPGGESVSGVQKRAVDTVERLRKKHMNGKKVLVVSHADVIKVILLHYLNLPLDHLQLLGCDNGSLSVFRFGTAWGDRLVALNYFADVGKILP
ncbi:MAG: histidine phosphatase family protein [Deltaproteobacteria bacterium]|nr:histidine phosphatase family protein [Deltaproteobacteria bacterium]